MLEKVDELDFTTVSEDDINTLVSDILSLDGQERIDAVLKVIDLIPYGNDTELSDDTELPPLYLKFFSVPEFRLIMDNYVSSNE